MRPAQAPREERLGGAFVELAEALVSEFDTVEMLDRLAAYCVDLLDVAAAGLLIADRRGILRVVAASVERSRLLELFEAQSREGPSSDCFRTGEPRAVEDLSKARGQRPGIARLAEEAGFRSVQALPMRVRNEVIGTLNLFRSQPGRMSAADLRVGQALADIASVSILQSRAAARAELLAGQLQDALESRVVLEQAKGVVAERGDLEIDEALARIRSYAQATGQRLGQVATDVVGGRVDMAALLGR
jgi:GAF domain-containing protein